MFVLNVLTCQGAVGSAALNGAMLRGQIAFLRAAAAAGMPVTMVELGNELYGAAAGGPRHAGDRHGLRAGHAGSSAAGGIWRVAAPGAPALIHVPLKRNK